MPQRLTTTWWKVNTPTRPRLTAKTNNMPLIIISWVLTYQTIHLDSYAVLEQLLVVHSRSVGKNQPLDITLMSWLQDKEAWHLIIYNCNTPTSSSFCNQMSLDLEVQIKQAFIYWTPFDWLSYNHLFWFGADVLENTRDLIEQITQFSRCGGTTSTN